MARTRSKLRLGEHALPLALTAVAVWLVAALIVHSFPGLFESKLRLGLALLAMLPIAETILVLVGVVLGLERPKRLPAASLLAIVALACHTVALVWWPSLYGNDETIVRHGGAWVTWTFTSLVVMAWFEAER
jgi:uncharacterized membrane protein YhdT